MERRVHPETSNSNISSTSRHELRELKPSALPNDLLQDNHFSFSNLRLKFFVAQLAKKIKFLAPPYTRSEHVWEEWEQALRNEEAALNKCKPELFRKETLSEEIFNRYQSVHIFYVLQGILIVLFSWIVTISLVFQEKVLTEVLALVAAVCLWDLAVKGKIAWNEREETNIYEISWSEDFLSPLMLLLAALLMIVRNSVNEQGLDYFVIPFEIISIYWQWQKIGTYFDFLKLYAEQNKKRKELRIIELFCFTLVMAHIFALLMYSMTYICPSGQSSWITKADLEGKPWWVLYIYSYYWANTTMVTVGYGDLTPNNYSEAIVVTLIQIVGTAIFGYMINVIGLTVNEIQKKNMEFEELQSTIVKLRDHYNLSRELCYKMKSDIKKRQSEMKETPLKNDEEREFLTYIDSSLKEQFVLETNIRVIKKSIFFLTYFTVHFQNEIALKLIRCIYKPEEVILSCQQGEKQLVIINNGKVNIHYTRNHHDQQLSKLARVIKPEEGKPTLNVYGYSSLILNRHINLKAITEETTTAYILKRKDILESLGKSILDFESFNELRQKMQQSIKFEEIEAPALKDQEHHFIPNTFLLLKKIKSLQQGRTKINRGLRKQKRSVITMKHYRNKTMLYIPAVEEPKEEEFDINIMLEADQRNAKIGKVSCTDQGDGLVMDQAKNFENFLKNFNLAVVAKDYEAACSKQTYLNRCKTVHKQLGRSWFRLE